MYYRKVTSIASWNAYAKGAFGLWLTIVNVIEKTLNTRLYVPLGRSATEPLFAGLQTLFMDLKPTAYGFTGCCK
jgi:hypothetical protein